MAKFKKLICLLLVTITSLLAVAQNNTNSPYTRYGFGELANQNFGNSKAMGDVAIGLRDGMHINPINPASYTGVDSLTFLFEGGVSLQNNNLSDGENRINAKNSSFDYVAMQFRLHKCLGMSLGIMPYSSVGYNVGTQENSSTLEYTKQMYGDGGLHQFYLGLGVRPFKYLSLGANISYLFGNIDRTLMMVYPSYTSGTGSSVTPSYMETAHLKVKDYKLDFGVQYTQPIGEKHSFTLGGIFSYKKNLHNEGSVKRVTNVTTVTDTVAGYQLPMTWGVGATYTFDDRLTVGVDYSFQKWSDVMFQGKRDGFDDRTKISAGIEYLPEKMSRHYLGLVKYRIGGYYASPYYKTPSGQAAAKEFGLSAGFGFPVPRARTMVNVSAQYVHVQGLQKGMVDENIIRLNIGITFNETWFFKRKVD